MIPRTLSHLTITQRIIACLGLLGMVPVGNLTPHHFNQLLDLMALPTVPPPPYYTDIFFVHFYSLKLIFKKALVCMNVCESVVLLERVMVHFKPHPIPFS